METQDRRLAVEEFFRTFEYNSNHGDTAAMVTPFASVFLAAGPQGSTCVRKEDFAMVLPKRKELFTRLGCHATELTHIETDALDARYSKAYTRWKMAFAQEAGSSCQITVGSTYIVDTGVEPFEIVLYLAHQDIMAVLKEQGLLPG